MLNFALFGNEHDMLLLKKVILNEAAFWVKNKWIDITFLSTEEDVRSFLKKDSFLEIIFVDVSTPIGLEYARLFRNRYPQTSIVLLADEGISPEMYVRPDILASTLILKPIDPDHAQSIICDFFQKSIWQMDKEKMFILKNKEPYRIPYSSILYFEAKKNGGIYIHTEGHEYVFSTSLKKIEEKCSSDFIRCHRSYLVNRRIIRKVQFGRNRILCEFNIELPISRKYKPNFKRQE